MPNGDGRLVIVGPEARRLSAAGVALLRIRTVEAPHLALTLDALAAGRRLLSDDVRLLESVARIGARRIDALRVAQERLERTVREQQIERLASEAELRALRAQLNPHFLFNALTTIGYLVTTSPARALDTLLRLTSVLRGVLRRTAMEFSTLGDEIDLVQAYLEIERARFEERLVVTIDVEPSARHLLVPALLLQPLVENAVKHGLAPRATGGRIAIQGASSGEQLAIRITDTGLGFDATARARTGLGLASVEQRLQAHYGAAASCRIESAIGSGTVVDLVLPAQTAAGATGAARRKAG